MDENSKLVFDASPDESLSDVVLDAVDVCPVQAIRLEH